MLDIIGSLAIRGAIIAVMLSLVVTMRDVLYQKTSSAVTEQNLAQAEVIMEKDFTLAGYNIGVLDPIITASSTEIKFYADLGNNDVLDVINYKLANTTPDTSIKVLRRIINSGTPLDIARGALTLQMQYFDSLNVETSNLPDIRGIKVKMSLEDTYPGTNGYAMIRRDFSCYPTNLVIQ